ncbi:MAG TPA: 2'-5' RNA ligase family protein [Candidatus Paceibacterota bacterium]|nr:2'-5' RNA ligase family protein [Candidatus Paceibacterota bacterium]
MDPRSNETAGYHLFLEPTGALNERLQETIRTLAAAYDGPIFPPHVTILANLEGNEEDILSHAQMLAQQLPPLTVMLGELGGEPSFFRAFYLTIKEDPELMSAHEVAQQTFGTPAEPYRPHLSLYYGNIDDGVREAMRSAGEYPSGESFRCDRLALYRTVGPADQWLRIGEVPFTR